MFMGGKQVTDDIMQQLVSAARAGDGPLLDRVDQIDPSHYKYLVAALVLTVARFHTTPGQSSA